MGLSGGCQEEVGADNIKQDILKFFYFVVHTHPQHRSLSYRDVLLNKHCLQEYLDYLDKNIGPQPSTMMNKMRKLTLAIQFVNFVENPNGTDYQLNSRCHTLVDTLKNWVKSLRQPRAKQKSDQFRTSTAKVNIITQVIVRMGGLLKICFENSWGDAAE